MKNVHMVVFCNVLHWQWWEFGKVLFMIEQCRLRLANNQIGNHFCKSKGKYTQIEKPALSALGSEMPELNSL